MLKLLWHIVEMNNTGVNRSVLAVLMKVELRIPSGSYNLHFVSNSQN